MNACVDVQGSADCYQTLICCVLQLLAVNFDRADVTSDRHLSFALTIIGTITGNVRTECVNS